MNMLQIEKKYWKKNLNNIAGIDEAGRGPLAGPVVAACVIFKKDEIIDGIKDSKKLTEKKRDVFYSEIYDKALSIGVGIIHEDIIDKINILQATYLAMKCAIGNLDIKPDIILIDGPGSNIKYYKVDHIINGDNISQTIAAASIIAKVTRDKIMREYHKIFPDYKFQKNKGYGTKYHMNILKNKKSTPIHRKSFKLVKDNLATIKFIRDNYGFNNLGKCLAGSHFVKKNYKIYNSNLVVEKIDDIIDFCFLKNEIFLFVKVITICNNKKYSIGNTIISEKSNYINFIDGYLKEKDVSNNFNFNVISINILKNNKPKINILYSDHIKI